MLIEELRRFECSANNTPFNDIRMCFFLKVPFSSANIYRSFFYFGRFSVQFSNSTQRLHWHPQNVGSLLRSLMSAVILFFLSLLYHLWSNPQNKRNNNKRLYWPESFLIKLFIGNF